MEVSYHREMKKNYLMIEADEESMQAFEAKMLVGNAIEGLLNSGYAEPMTTASFVMRSPPDSLWGVFWKRNPSMRCSSVLSFWELPRP